MFQALSFLILSFLLATAAFLPDEKPSKQLDSKGVLNLDALTYKKLIPSDKYTCLVFVYSKAGVGDYGTDSLRSDYYAFAKKALTEGESDELLFTQIVVNGADNLNLATRLGMKKDFQYPQLFLIKRGEKKAIPYPTTSPFRLYELVVFTSKHSSFYLKQAGRTKLLNKLRSDFIGANSKDERSKVLADARSAIETLPSIEKLDAEYHLGVLEKIHADGLHELTDEIASIKSSLPKTKGADLRLHELHLDVLEELLSQLDTKEL